MGYAIVTVILIGALVLLTSERGLFTAKMGSSSAHGSGKRRMKSHNRAKRKS